MHLWLQGSSRKVLLLTSEMSAELTPPSRTEENPVTQQGPLLTVSSPSERADNLSMPGKFNEIHKNRLLIRVR